MNNIIFLSVSFLPFVFLVYFIFKRLFLAIPNKTILNYGLIFASASSFIASISAQFLFPDSSNIFLIIANLFFIFLSVFTYFYFKSNKQFMFKHLRYNIFLSLFIIATYIFILSNNLVLSGFMWVLSGVLIYIFSYFDIFKTNSNYNPNRFYSIFLAGDFCLVIAILIFIKYSDLSGNYSYFLKYDDLKMIASYVIGNSDFEYVILPACLVVALFTRSFIFPFSCFFSFLANSSGLFYITLYSILSPFYSLVLFLKLDLFDGAGFYFKIFLLISILIILVSLLFEKDFKIIFGYLLSMMNSIFILMYFYNDKIAFVFLFLIYTILISTISSKILKDKTSIKKRLINTNSGFMQERAVIYIFEKLPAKMSVVIEFLDKNIIRKIFGFLYFLFSIISYEFFCFTQKKDIFSIIKGIMIIFSLFALLAIFIALFGNYGEMQS